jgi:hypothetical protein
LRERTMFCNEFMTAVSVTSSFELSRIESSYNSWFIYLIINLEWIKILLRLL